MKKAGLWEASRGLEKSKMDRLALQQNTWSIFPNKWIVPTLLSQCPFPLSLLNPSVVLVLTCREAQACKLVFLSLATMSLLVLITYPHSP